MLTPKKREYLFSYIQETAIAVSMGFVTNDVIDAIGIGNASKLAMKRAIEGLVPAADSLIVDYFKLPDVNLPQKGVVDGDVTRDFMMMEMDNKYPGFGLCHHKGYGTREHWRCIETKGLLPIHRLSFCHLRERF
jgi:ribonuclease HII